MEGKIIKNIITAIGNPILNNKLKKIENINVLNNDILYQEGIFEILDLKKEIDFLILSQILPGNYFLEELIEKIKEKNNKIKIIIILENINNELENILTKKGIYRILYNNSIEINDVLNIINEDEKMEKYIAGGGLCRWCICADRKYTEYTESGKTAAGNAGVC